MKRLGIFITALLVSAGLLAGCAPAGRVRQASSLPPTPSVRFIRFTAADGIELRGRLFGAGRTGVVLAHMYPSNQNSWSQTAKTLSARGYAVLTFDFRGYGLSGGTRKIAKIDKDMLAAYDWLRQRTGKVFLVGASMGGTASLKVASLKPVAGVATLSAPPEFMGLTAGEVRAIKGPKLFMAAAEDGPAPGFARQFYGQAGEPREIQIVPGGEHGTDLLRGDNSETLRLLLDWLKRND